MKMGSDGTCRKVSELGWVAMLLCVCIATQIFRDALSVCRSSGCNRCRVELHLCWLMSIGSCQVMPRDHAICIDFSRSFNSRNCCSSSSARLCSRRCFSQRPCLRRKHSTCILYILMISYDFIYEYSCRLLRCSCLCLLHKLKTCPDSLKHLETIGFYVLHFKHWHKRFRDSWLHILERVSCRVSLPYGTAWREICSIHNSYPWKSKTIKKIVPWNCWF